MADTRAPYNLATSSALPDSRAFQQARRRADAEKRLARLTGRSAALLCFDRVRDLLKAHPVSEQVLRDVPLDAITGSVGRCADYTRSFRPLKDNLRQRWEGIKAALARSKPLPPIQVGQLGETYFVFDGHHRVSVAREHGMTSIEALVLLFEAEIPPTPYTQTGKLTLQQAELAALQEHIRVDQSHPKGDLDARSGQGQCWTPSGGTRTGVRPGSCV
jgi:hypothetical protein